MKIIITGGEGFIGTNLSLNLLKTFKDITSIDSRISNTKNKIILKDKIEIKSGDIKEMNNLKEIIRGSNIIVHLAASGNVVESVSNPIDNFQNNVLTTLKLLEAAKDENIKNIIFASTGGALMGNTEPPVNEKSLPSPISPYGASKLCCEGYLSAYANSYGINSVALRFGNVYGEYSSHKKGVINQWIKNSLLSKDICIYGDGESTRDYIHVNDICNGIIKAINYLTNHKGKDPYMEIFHLANNQETKLIDLANLILDSTKSNSKIIFKNERKGEVGRNCSSYEKAKNVLEFTPKIDIKEGIQSLVEWIKNDLSKES